MVRHLNSHSPKTVILPGPEGNLAATLEAPKASPVGAVLHLHPHPQHGGTRRNNVVRYGALGSLEAGCVALRLDFRGRETRKVVMMTGLGKWRMRRWLWNGCRRSIQGSHFIFGAFLLAVGLG